MVAMAPRIITRLIHPLLQIYRGTPNLVVNRCFDTFKPVVDDYVVPAAERLFNAPVKAHNAIYPIVNTLGDLVGGLPTGLSAISSNLCQSGTLAIHYMGSSTKLVIGEVFLFTARRVVFPILSESFELAKPYIRLMVLTDIDDLIDVYSMKYDPTFAQNALGGDLESSVIADTSGDITLNDLEVDKVHNPHHKPSISSKTEDVFSVRPAVSDLSPSSSSHAVDTEMHQVPEFELNDFLLTGMLVGDRSLSSSMHAVNPEMDNIPKRSDRFFTTPPKFRPRLVSSLRKCHRSLYSRRSAKELLLGI